MSVHAFVDESYRDGRYLLAAAVIDPGDLRRLRVVMRGLLLPGQREVHLKTERHRRGQLLDQVVNAGARGQVYCAAAGGRRGQEDARVVCLQWLVKDLLEVGAHRLVLDSRQDRDLADARVIRAALGRHPAVSHLTYEHVDSASEPLIWVADMIGWAYGAGGDWRRRVTPALLGVIDCG